MPLGQILRIALAAIRANRLRSFLTMLGIIIGVGAVITMVALGTGAQRAVQGRLEALGPDLLTVYPGQMWRMGVASDQRVGLTVEDADILAREALHVAGVVPELWRGMPVKRGNKNVNVNIIGTTPEYVPVKRFQLANGRMFTAGQNESRDRVAVIGSAVPDMLGVNPAAVVGQDIQVGTITFEVIGVLQEKGSQGSFMNLDEQILVPLDTARYRLMGTDRLRAITVKAADMSTTSLTMLEIERVLRREHKIRPGMENDFQIRRQADVLSTMEDTTKTFTRLLAGIAAVSLLVGGIGIMNIMLVSVTERTREIGVRKALGATKRMILTQFLVEALALCLVGGLIGVVVGSSGALLLAHFNRWNADVSMYAIALAFLFSAVVGVFFGMWPARRAANLDPIEALRTE
jgi:putative ABC transport system permease protein